MYNNKLYNLFFIFIYKRTTQKNILYQNMELYDDKKEEIMIQLCMAF